MDEEVLQYLAQKLKEKQAQDFIDVTNSQHQDTYQEGRPNAYGSLTSLAGSTGRPQEASIDGGRPEQIELGSGRPEEMYIDGGRPEDLNEQLKRIAEYNRRRSQLRIPRYVPGYEQLENIDRGFTY